MLTVLTFLLVIKEAAYSCHQDVTTKKQCYSDGKERWKTDVLGPLIKSQSWEQHSKQIV